MGIIYEGKDYGIPKWSIEERTESVAFNGPIFAVTGEERFEIDYKDLDDLQRMIGIAQQNRRDR
jgi:hypothetical protein